MNALTTARRLTLTTYEELKKTISVEAVYLLSDSEIVLNWLKNEDTSKVIGHKREDCATRGLRAEELHEHIWWKGPEFLSKEQKDWPEETRLFEVPLETADVLQISVQKEDTPLFNVDRFSSMSKLGKTVTYVLKFLNRATRNLPDATKDRITKAIGMEKENEATTPI
ncbi:hypothetical protein ANCDUO_08666 [Ancylostoma duodenale]|uniref:Uncharacterized protein n=1 Tax=Ancylostoma duodenale TaxID=51022 RepID=A0A0C2GPS7_9BILA|nr:hypothetical protein ANCDUO_08666 [Ancylostoma duodenale]